MVVGASSLVRRVIFAIWEFADRGKTREEMSKRLVHLSDSARCGSGSHKAARASD